MAGQWLDNIAQGTPTPAPTLGGEWLDESDLPEVVVKPTGEGDGFLAKINAVLRKPSPEWLQAPEQVARETITGMTPHDLPSYLASLYPPAAFAKHAVDVGEGVAQGDYSGIPFVGRVPEIIEADQTPAGSVERYRSARNVLMDLGLLAGGGERPVKPIDMPGSRGFRLGPGKAPAHMPETPIPPSWQPIEPGAPIPFGPEYAAWEQQRYGGPQTPDLGMWPLSSAGQQQPPPGSLEALAAAIRQQPAAPTLAERFTQPRVEPSVPQPPAPATPSITSMFSAKGATDALYQKAFDALRTGQTTISGLRDPILARHKAAFDRGEITSPADLKARKEGTTPPIAPAAPLVLRAGEQGTGELFQGADQPFNLAGEAGIDTEAIQAAKEAEAKAKAKADADFEKNQLQLLGAEMTPEEEAAMRHEYEQDSLAQLEEHMARGGDELVDVLKSHGLPLINKAAHYRGELNAIREFFTSHGSKTGRKGYGSITTGAEKLKYGDIFKTGGGTLDSLTDLLRSKGFEVDDVSDALELINERLRSGKKIYGDEARATELEAQSFGRGRIERAGEAGGIPLPFKGRVMDPGAVKGSGRYKDVYQINKEAGDKINNLASSRESAELRATIQTRKVFGDLTPREQDALGHYLVSERLKTVNPDHPQILSPMQSAGIIRQPRIARALNRYKAEVKPEIEMLRKKAGLTAEAAAGKGAEFISLIPATEDMLPSVATPMGTVPLRFRSKTTRFARRAEGMAARYETDLPELLRASYREVTQKARLRDFYEHLEMGGLASRDAVDEIRGRPAVPVAIGRAAAGELSTALPEVTFMPAPIADALRDVMETPPAITHPVLKAGKAAQRAITGAALTANPAELLNHMRRQLDIVAAQPAANMPLGVRLTEAVVPYFGPRLGVAVRTLTENMSTPANQAVLQDIFDAGGGSHRAFEEYQAKGFLARKTGLSHLQHFTQQMLFGIPEGRGVKGWDLRMRVQLEKIRRSVEGNTDPQRIREFANQIGQYTSKPDKLIEVARTVNPYAATTLPMRATELKQLFGSSGLKAQGVGQALALRGETLLRGVGGTIIALTTANYMLSGKYPWENDKGHEFDLNTGMKDAKGKTVYVKLRAIAPTLSRPINTLSAPELLRERGAEKPDYVAAGAIGPANQALSLIGGPLQNTALAAATGYAPYFTRIPGRPPGLYDVAKGGPSDHRGINNLVAAIQGINPIGRGFEKPEAPLPGPLQYIERPIPGVEPLGRIFTRSYEKAEARPQTIAQKIRAQKAAATHKRIKELRGY